MVFAKGFGDANLYRAAARPLRDQAVPFLTTFNSYSSSQPGRVQTTMGRVLCPSVRWRPLDDDDLTPTLPFVLFRSVSAYLPSGTIAVRDGYNRDIGANIPQRRNECRTAGSASYQVGTQGFADSPRIERRSRITPASTLTS